MTQQDGDRLMTVKEIAAEYGLHPLTVQRILKAKKVANVIKFSNKSGYRVRKRDWDAYVTKRYRWTGDVVDEDA